MSAYLPIFAMLVLAALFAALSFVASSLLGPKRPTAAKDAPYECGIVPTREPAHRFPVRFYLVAMIFIIFDIEIIFLYPYAVANKALGLFGLVEIVLFIVTVFVAYAYVWRRGGLDWD
jgi:NADH-quinone oxidoreductase subunit A